MAYSKRGKYQKIWKQKSKKKNTLLEHAKNYTKWLIEQNYSPHTYQSRRSFLGLFLTWCSENNIRTIYEVTNKTLERYQNYLLYHESERYKTVLSTNARRLYLLVVSLFFRWLVKKHHLIHNPANTISIPKPPKHLPRNILTQEEVEQIVSSQDLTKPLSLRNRAMIETLYSTGIRASELQKLIIDDIDFKRETLLIREGKGKKDRVVPIGERAIKWINKYIKEERVFLVKEETENKLFLSQYGKPFKTPSTLYGTIIKVIRTAGVTKSGGLHLFRHTFATAMLENGASTRYIQEMLGHRDLESTQRYTKVCITKLKQIHALTHPGELAWSEEREGEYNA